MAIILNKGIYLLPSVETEKGTFFIRSYYNSNEDKGAIIYNENGEVILDQTNIYFKESDEDSIDRLIYFIENSDLF